MSKDLPENSGKRFQLRDIPAMLTARDLITLVIVTVSFASAFFMYDTRISLLELQQQVQMESNQEQKALEVRLRQAETEMLSLKGHLERDVNQHADIKSIERRVRELEYEIKMIQIQLKPSQ